MNISNATQNYENWLSTHTSLIEADLTEKHRQMAEGAFPFLRGTYYRWAQRWPVACPQLSQAPVVLAVSDLHVENFGTWRDSEGRLVWGVNDFDEAYLLPYTNDLVRLATSVLLAVQSDHLATDPKTACEELLAGYAEGLRSNGRPFVIEEDNRWFLPLLQRKSKASDPKRFWDRLRILPERQEPVPKPAVAALAAMLPEPGLDARIVPRTAGVGSLGKPRFVALATWCGGPVAREAKALTPSAGYWAAGLASGPVRLASLLAGAVRCPDPFFRIQGDWIVRRLAPDCNKIELKTAAEAPDEALLLRVMGTETANIHWASRDQVPAILHDLGQRPHKWLYKAAKEMLAVTLEDHREWQQAHAI